MADVSQFFDKDYEQKEFDELADAPVDAIQGLSQSDAEALKQALNIRTIRDLAEHKFVRIAQAAVALSGSGEMAKVNPVQVQKFLGGLDYPASKEDLIKHAQQKGADEHVRSTLERLPDRNYEAPPDVSKAIGEIH